SRSCLLITAASARCRRAYSSSEKRGYSCSTIACRRGSSRSIFLARQLLGDRLAQLRLVELADPRHRESVDDLDALRKFEFCKSFTVQKASKGAYIRRLHARARNEISAGALDQHLVWHRHHRDVGHRRVLADEVLHLLGAELLPAAVDVVLQPALERVVQPALDAVRFRQVAGAHKALRGQRFARLPGGVVIAAQAGRPAEAELAHF